jgi:hypothetical protein
MMSIIRSLLAVICLSFGLTTLADSLDISLKGDSVAVAGESGSGGNGGIGAKQS